MNDLIFYRNVTVELQEHTLVKTKLPKISYRQEYGGLQYLNMLKNMIGFEMYAREWENHLVMMSFLYNSSVHYNILKNGLLISWV
jgi:hypothetical protein